MKLVGFASNQCREGKMYLRCRAFDNRSFELDEAGSRSGQTGSKRKGRGRDARFIGTTDPYESYPVVPNPRHGSNEFHTA